jgi:hypothetical protein
METHKLRKSVQTGIPYNQSHVERQDYHSSDCGDDSASILVVQDNVDEATMNRQSVIVVIYEAKPAELVHEMTDPRPGCADHLRQVILTDPGNHRFSSAFLSEMSKLQENPRQPFLA